MGKESVCNAGEVGSVPGWGRSPGGQHGNPLQYSCLKNPRGRGAWWAIVHRVTKSRTQLKQLSTNTHTYSWLTMFWWFQVNSKGTQPYIYMYPFSPILLSHPGCHITSSRVKRHEVVGQVERSKPAEQSRLGPWDPGSWTEDLRELWEGMGHQGRSVKIMCNISVLAYDAIWGHLGVIGRAEKMEFFRCIRM